MKKRSLIRFSRTVLAGIVALSFTGSFAHAGPTQSSGAVVKTTSAQGGVVGTVMFGFPVSGSVNVSTLTNLNWVPATNATVYDVYFGTDSTPDETEFMESVGGTGFDLDTLDPFTTYYWRINARSNTSFSTGVVFSFTTGAEAVFDLNVVEVSYDTSVPLPVDEDILVHTVVTNDGDLFTTSLHISYYASDDNIITEDDRRIDFDIITADIPGFGTFEEDRLVYIPEDLRGEEFYIGVIVTGTGDVPEENLSNNVLSGSSPLNTVAVHYDLVAVECTYDIFDWHTQGDTVAIEYIVSNEGDFYSIAPMDFYLSEDAIITPSDIYIGSQDANVQPGSMSDWYTWMVLPEVMPTGDWYIGFIVSGDGVVDATPEDNWASGIAPVYVVGTAACDADLNGDGDLNFFDVSLFLSLFAAQDPDADFSGDGQYNFFDVSAFLAAFGDGCP